MIIGVDIGTSLTKASLITRDGDSLLTATKESVLNQMPGGKVEQDFDDVLSTVRYVIREVAASADDIEGIAFTGQGDGLWLRDADGRPVRDPISWMDGRGSDLVSDWSSGGRESVAHRIYRNTGSGIFPGCAAPLLRWMADHEPENLDRAAVAGYCVDAVVGALTGEITVDASDASLPFLNVRTREYSQDALDACGVGSYRRLLAEPAPPGHVFELSRRGADQLGLPAGTPITAGPFDLPACAFGAGVTEPGDGTLVVGTTLGCEVLTDDPTIDPDGEPAGMWLATPHPAEYLRVMPAMVGTASIDWLMNLFGRRAWHVGELLDQSPPGANGVSALSFLSPSGERAPFVDPNARGQLSGLSLDSNPADIARALCEGIAYAARHCLEAGGLDGELSACGGGMKSAEWGQIFADVVGREIHLPIETGVGARGAAMAAWDALGKPVDRDEWKQRRRVFTPEPERVDFYERGYAGYRERLDSARLLWGTR